MASTKIDCGKTAGEIMQLLSKFGATKILTLYENGEITGLSFMISRNKKELPFKLPIRWQPVLKAMENDRQTPRSFYNPEQAHRVAWRQIKRWIEAQLALLEVNMVELEEIFMPYLMVNQEETFYEKLAKNNFKQIEYEP